MLYLSAFSFSSSSIVKKGRIFLDLTQSQCFACESASRTRRWAINGGSRGVTKLQAKGVQLMTYARASPLKSQKLRNDNSRLPNSAMEMRDGSGDKGSLLRGCAVLIDIILS